MALVATVVLLEAMETEAVVVLVLELATLLLEETAEAD
jgi:hypothetical protein